MHYDKFFLVERTRSRNTTFVITREIGYMERINFYYDTILFCVQLPRMREEEKRKQQLPKLLHPLLFPPKSQYPRDMQSSSQVSSHLNPLIRKEDEGSGQDSST